MTFEFYTEVHMFYVLSVLCPSTYGVLKRKGVTEPPALSSRVSALRSVVSTTAPSPSTLPHSGTPGFARVTSISSSLNAPASLSSKSKGGVDENEVDFD